MGCTCTYVYPFLYSIKKIKYYLYRMIARFSVKRWINSSIDKFICQLYALLFLFSASLFCQLHLIIRHSCLFPVIFGPYLLHSFWLLHFLYTYFLFSHRTLYYSHHFFNIYLGWASLFLRYMFSLYIYIYI